MKMKVLPPDINSSDLEFTVPEKWSIRWGLAAIKGIGATSVKALVDERTKNGPFKNLFDMARRVNLHADVSKKTMELLIKTGAMDQFGMTREHMLSIVADVVKYSETHFTAKKQGQRSLFDFGDDQEQQETSSSQDAHPSWLGDPSKKCPITLESLEEERKLTGLYLTGHPIDFYAADCRKFSKTTLADAPKFASLNGKDKIHLVAIFQGGNIGISKKDQKPRAFVTLDDRSATVEAMMFEKDIPPAFPPEGAPVWVQASIRKLPDGTTTRMKLDRILTLEEVRQQAIKSYTISVDLRQGATTEADVKIKLNQLASFAAKNKGPTKLKIELQYPESTVVMNAAQQIELTNEFMRTVHTSGLKGRYE
jgi:DNA polymerase-3 subunit alpha